MTKLLQIKKFVLDIFYPNRCPVCSTVILWNELVCEECINEIAISKTEFCHRCGKANCVCEQMDIKYDLCLIGGIYENAIKKGVISLKLNNGVNFAHYMVNEAVNDDSNQKFFEDIDCVTCVPMTSKKARKRGYNQADIIARYMAELLVCKYEKGIIIKNYDGKEQHNLNFSQRVEAVKDAYRTGVNANYLLGKTVLICDDVVTTTSTLSKCAELLKEIGAQKVICFCVSSTENAKNTCKK